MELQNQPQVVTVYLSKGGVGKSTLVMLLATFLAALGYRVVILDLDRQGSQSMFFDLVDDTGRGGEALHLVLKRRLDLLAALTPVGNLPTLDGFTPGTLHIAQGGAQTTDAINDIAANPVRYKIANTLDIVRGPVAQLAGHADFVLIDMGPSDQIAALAGLAATHKLIIPTTMDFPSVTRIAPVMDEVEVARQINPGLEILGIVPMMTRYYFGGLRKSQNVQVGEDFLQQFYGDLLLRENGHMVDFPYNEEVHKAVWSGVSLLSDAIGKTTRAEALRLLNTLAVRLGLNEVAHV